MITRFHSNKWYDISIAQELTIPSNCDRIAELLAGRVIPSKWSLLKQNYNYPGKNHNQNFTRLTRLESIQMGFSRRSAYFHLYVRVNTMERTETITFQHYLNKIRIIFVGSCPLCYCHSLSLAPTRHSSQYTTSRKWWSVSLTYHSGLDNPLKNYENPWAHIFSSSSTPLTTPLHQHLPDFYQRRCTWSVSLHTKKTTGSIHPNIDE